MIRFHRSAAFRATLAKSRGFTLLEMFIAVAILMILIGVGAPSMRSFLASSKLSSSAASYHGAILFAQDQASQLGRGVMLCPNDGACGASINWQSAGIKVVDSNDNNVVYRTWPAAGSGVGLTSSAAVTSITFNPDGTTDLTGTLTMRFCDPSAAAGSPGRLVKVNSAGFVSMAVANSKTPGVYALCS